MNDFVHLHVHSEYSLLDGYAATSAIVARAAELGMDSIALTDHGVMYGAIEFAAAARKAGVKPIIGVEAYIAPGSRADAMSRGTKNYHHLLLLAQNATGYRNLTTRAHLEGMGRGIFARPRIDRELLEQHHEGLIVTSSCIAGEVIQALQDGQGDQARHTAAWYRDLLGPERYFLEVQLHDNTPELETINDELVRIGKELGIPLVATSDTHFVRREDLEAQKMIMAMGMGMSYAEFCSKSYAMDETYHIASGDEMWQRFRRYGTAVLENTRRIADQCQVSFDFGRVKLPEFTIPAGHDAASYLRFVCEEGLMRRCNGAPPETYITRLAYELDVINRTGFPDYMLIVWDYVRYARGRGIPCVPRGSAGASLVLYALEITDVDPLANKLLFERFLSPERLEMPDIDIDFADSRRGEVLDYIAGKYGRENTAQIITYGTLGARAALKDMGRVLEIPISDVERVTRLIPTQPVGTTLGKALETVTELRELYEQNPDARRLIDWARRVEGRMRSVGTHACGVVISRAPLDQLVPLQRTTKDEQAVMAAYEGPTLAKIGLLKMDILGLTNLSVVADTLRYIKETTGQVMELGDIPLDDPQTFAALSQGNTVNVFQLESAGMVRYLKELKPTRVQDIYAMVALYRPGPLEQIPVYIQNKNNPKGIKYLHPILKPILEDTYGVIVYQEQIMQLLQVIAGYTLGQAYIVLKAIGKKQKDLMAAEEPRFKEGCLKNGLTQAQADTLWDLIQPFAGYSFNRPHATLYGLLSYQTAYLKNNFPTQYMAAVLRGAGGQIEDVAKAVNECAKLGVPVLKADINASTADFRIETLDESVVGGAIKYASGIRFGLAAIKNVGEGPVEAIIAARNDQPFRSFEDFCDRVDHHAINKRVVESLIKAGALDSLAGSRLQKLAVLDQVLDAGQRAQKARATGQSSLFDLFGSQNDSGPTQSINVSFPIINETREQKRELLTWEKELLGTYISDHPVIQALRDADLSDITLLSAINDELVGQALSFAGMLTNTKTVTTKKGDNMFVGTFEDMEGSMECVAFPKVFEKFQALLHADAIVRIIGKLDRRNEGFQIIIDKVESLKLRDTPLPTMEVAISDTDEAPMAEQSSDMTPPALNTSATPAPAPAPEVNIPSPPPPVAPAPPAAKATTPPPPASRSDIIKTAPRTTQQPKTAAAPVAPPPASNGHEANGPSHVLHIYFPLFDDHESAVQLMHEIYAVTEHYRTSTDGEAVMMIHLPVQQREVVLQMRGTLRDPIALSDTLKSTIGAEAVVLESA